MQRDHSTGQLELLRELIREYLEVTSRFSSDEFIAKVNDLFRDQLKSPDEFAMELAIELAEKQLERYPDQGGPDRPNPLVGCVVVTRDLKVVSAFRGDTEGENDHAEFIALTKRGLSDEELQGATVYTTLEPCCERGPGKTPCADWLINKRVRRVVIGILDKDPLGMGVRKLVDAGIEVARFTKGLQDRIADLNTRFLSSRVAGEKFAEILGIEEFLWRSRPLLQNVNLSDFLGISAVPEFPLVVGQNYIPESPIPISISAGCDLLANLDRATFEDSAFDSEFANDMFLGHQYCELKGRVAKSLGRPMPLNDDYCYRLMSVDFVEGVPRFGFSRSRYFGYVNSCEVLAFEAAQQFRRGDSKRSKAGLRALRGAPDRVFDLSWRNAVVGVNTILILIDQRSGKSSFVVHHRKNVAEAVGTLHVVPAGTFQPMATSVGGGWNDSAWEKDFSLADCIIREFLEEVLGLGNKIEHAARLGDWRNVDEEVASAYSALCAAGSDGSDDAKFRLWYLGFGFDPLTLKPEFITCMVMDRQFFTGLRATWSNEGRGQKVEFSLEELDAVISAQDTNWLSAGRACVELAKQHYPVLASSLLGDQLRRA